MASVRTSWLLLITCGAFQLVHCLLTWPIPIIKNDHIALAESVAYLTRHHFSKVSNTVVVLERSWKERMRHQHSRILEHILTNLQETMTVQLYNGQTDNQPWEYHIFVIDSIHSFDDIGWDFPRTYFERDFHFLIILTQFTPDFMDVLKNIFKSCRIFRVLNANVVLEHPDFGVCMFKYSLFSKDKCNEVQPYLYYCFKNGIHKLREVFPQKLLNYWGCPLRITGRHNPPNLKYFGNRSNIIPEKDWHSLGGVEGDLLKLISKTLNFTIDLVSLPDERKFYHNSSSYGCFAELMEGKADIAIGGFAASDSMRQVLTPSIVFHYSPIVFIVRQRMQISSVSRLFWPFNREVWIILASCLFLGSLALYILRLSNREIQNFVVGYRNHAPITNFIAVFLGYPMTRLPLRNFARYLLTIWLMMSLVIRNAYQGSLYDSFRTDRNERTPQDYDELVKWDYKIFMSTSFSIFLFNRSIIMDTGQLHRIKRLEQIKGRFATVASRDNFISYLEDNYRRGSKLVMVRRPAFMHAAVFFFQKHSIYVASINKKLKPLTYGGITKLMYTNNVKDYFLFRKYKKDSVTPEAIKFWRIKGVYDICGYMLILGCSVFVLELLSVHFENLRTLLQWLD